MNLGTVLTTPLTWLPLALEIETSDTAQAVLVSWLPVAATLFLVLRPRDALLTAFVVGWLFLPVGGIDLPGLPNYGKLAATYLGPLLGVLLFDARSLKRFRPHWVDVPLVLWCLAPIPSSLTNGLGLYDGLSGTLETSIHYGIPLVLGRVYLGSREGLFWLARYVIAGAVIYMPLCWLEIFVSPQLHTWVYGYIQHSFLQTIRYGGFRPLVFLNHGIAVSVLYGTATGALFWLWRSGRLKSMFGIPSSVLFAAMTATLIGCKTATGLALFALMCGCWWLSRVMPIRLFLLILVLVPAAYMALRSSNIVPAETLVGYVKKYDRDRAWSFEIRLKQEDLFTEHTMSRPLFGWGGWGRNFPRGIGGETLVRAVDGFWIVVLSKHGFFGLVVATGLMLVAPAMIVWRFSSRELSAPSRAPLAAMALVVCMAAIDSLVNSIPNPLFYLAMGGVTQIALTAKERLPVSLPAPVPLVPRKLAMELSP